MSDEETEDPRDAALRAQYEAERWLVSLAIGWAYVDEETRERALDAAIDPDMIGYVPLRAFMCEYLLKLGPDYVKPEVLAFATDELTRHKISPSDFVTTLQYLDTGTPPVLDEMLELLRVARLRRRLHTVCTRLSFAAATASPDVVRWLLSFVELHALPDVPPSIEFQEYDEDEGDEPTAHQWEQIVKEHETKHPEAAKRRRLPVVSNTDFGLWFNLNNCAFFKMMRASDNHDYNMWVALASQLQPYGERGREVFLRISAQDRELASEMIEHKWEQTRALSPMRCTTIAKQGWRCPHLDTVRCNGAPTPALLADHSYCEPTEVELR